MAQVDLVGKRVLVTLPLTEEQRAEFLQLVEGVGGTAVFVPVAEVTEEHTSTAALIIGNVPDVKLHAYEGLEWLQTSSAGYDYFLTSGTLAATTLLTNATGAYGQAVSEHMFAQLLCLMKKLHRYRDNQRASLWHDEGPVTTLVDAQVLVLGTGDIGQHFAQLVHAMGAHVVGVRRRVGECPEPFERVAGMDTLFDELAQADVVASVLPSTPQTVGLADARFFAAMKEGSYFINNGRGDLVVANDLIEALQSGRLAGAALDVTKPEPLPANHPLWQQENALITPHVAGFWHLDVTRENVIAIAYQNLQAYLAGEPLHNVVSR